MTLPGSVERAGRRDVFASSAFVNSSPALSSLQRSFFRQLGEAEVQQFDVAIAPEDEVFGLDVAVNDPGFVRGGQSAGDLNCHIERGIERHLPGVHPLAQRLAVNIFGDDEMEAPGLMFGPRRFREWSGCSGG